MNEDVRLAVEMTMLDLDENEQQEVERAVVRVVEYFALMDEADTDGVEAMTHAGIDSVSTRPDSPSRFVSADDVLSRAPELDDRFISVPNVL